MSKLNEYRKAVVAFLTTAVAEGTALLSLGVLSGQVSHDIALGIIIVTPLIGAIGVGNSKPNTAPVVAQAEVAPAQ